MEYALLEFVECLGEWLVSEIYDTLQEGEAARKEAVAQDPLCSPKNYLTLVMFDGSAKHLLALTRAMGFKPL